MKERRGEEEKVCVCVCVGGEVKGRRMSDCYGGRCVYLVCSNVCLQQLVFLEQVLYSRQVPTTVL